MCNKVLKCRDFGVDCPAEFRGKSAMEIIEQVRQHRIEAHGVAPDKADDDVVMKTAAAKIREE